MKKIAIIIVLCFSASVGMAQFGNLKDVIKQEESGTDSTSKRTDNPKEENPSTFEIFENALKDGFFCIRQDFQLEDTTTGKRYNYGDNQKKFGGQTSFVILFEDGFIVPEEILYPWEFDENYSDYKNKQYEPVVSKTSFLKAGQKGWRSEGLFLPVEEGSFANGLKYAVIETSVAKGLKRAFGFGKKEVWVAWLLLSKSENDSDVTCDFLIQKTELTLEKDNKLYKLERPDTKQTVLGGIVVEPTAGGIGTIDLALVGVVKQCDDGYKMSMLIKNEADVGSGALTPDDTDDEEE